MTVPAENELAFFPPSVRAGNVTLGPLTLAGAVRIGRLGVNLGRRVPGDRIFEVAWILAGGKDDYRRFLRRVRVGLKELSNAVEKVLNDAYSTYVKPPPSAGGTISLTPRGLGQPLEYAEFLCGEYGWSWDAAINTPLATVFALIAANRQRHGGKHGGRDYIQKTQRAMSEKDLADIDIGKEEAV